MSRFSNYADKLRAKLRKQHSVNSLDEITGRKDANTMSKLVSQLSLQPSSNSFVRNTSVNSNTHEHKLFSGDLVNDANVIADNSSSKSLSRASIPDKRTNYRDKVGQTFSFVITGSTNGQVWGTDIYTDDSNLAVAAVHAGIIKVGETKTVQIKILPGEESYEGTIRNGIVSSSYDAWEGSYSFLGPIASTKRIPSDLKTYRDKIGLTFTFVITGSTNGQVWGTGIYTDDSHLAVAAVHAGVIKMGETKTIQIQILPGEQSYEGSVRNGIPSSSYGAWEGSYSFVGTTIFRKRTLPDLRTYRDKVGQTFSFIITGSIAEEIWGTDIYTDDSNLAVAAVHAGAVNLGETKTVQIQILPGEQSYEGSIRNGITSSSYGVWEGSYLFVENTNSPKTTVPDLKVYRDKVGQTFSFQITGTNNGQVWGTDIYTDDSSLAAAAVHAGVVFYGETKTVNVQILPGQSTYQGASKNGVISSSYGNWEGSYSFVAEATNDDS